MADRAGLVEGEADRMEPNITADHTVKVVLEGGGFYPSIECHCDPADPKRPCWPHEENGEPFGQAEGTKAGCVYLDWMGEMGSESIVNEVALRFVLESAVWGGDGFDFELGELIRG